MCVEWTNIAKVISIIEFDNDYAVCVMQSVTGETWKGRRSCKKLIERCVRHNDIIHLREIFNHLNIPSELTLKEQLCYYQLLKEN